MQDSESPEDSIQILLDLVSEFDQHRDFYQASSTKEHRIRTKFINPILYLLGWDVKNNGLSPSDWEVIEEDTLSVEGSKKAPDYAFLWNRRRVFYLEAKKPSVSIEGNPLPARQIRRYCWNAGLPVGVVTDFEEWAIYDGRFPPKEDDSAEVGRIEYFTYQDLHRKWDWLKSTIGKKAVSEGSLDRLVGKISTISGVKTIDQSFLEEIRGWRQSLAEAIHNKQPEIGATELNGSIQTLINRIIFLRIAEARGLETEGTLLEVAQREKGVYEGLKEIFRKADSRYNSGLFNFSDNKSQLRKDSYDAKSLDLVIPDYCLREVLLHTYYPYPYEFSLIPSDILGRVYEQFLGEEIIISGSKVSTDLKMAVRKSGGVYYTPSEVVEYIVDQTVFPLLKKAQIGSVDTYRIVDPSCGSGSFLLVVYQRLIEWFTDYYSQRPTLAKKFLERKTSDSTLRLRSSERKKILQSMIYGVDLDPQAVEVTKLSLLLKVIEGQEQMELEVGHILPDISNNIKCGNSLIDSWDYGHEAIAESDVRPFNWMIEFPEVMTSGGFAAVVGNPPYFSIDATWGAGDPRLKHLKENYRDVYTDKTDILFYFIKRCIDLCKGEIGLIVSRSFLEADKAQKLREWIGGNSSIREILDFRDAQVFPGVGINTAIIRLSKSQASGHALIRRYKHSSLPKGYKSTHFSEEGVTTNIKVEQQLLKKRYWHFAAPEDQHLIDLIDAKGIPVGDILHIGQGMQTGANKVFQVDFDSEVAARLHREGHLRMRARNSDIRKYLIRDSGVYLIFPYAVSKFEELPEEIREHLLINKHDLTSRAAFKRGNCEWWKYTWALHLEYSQRDKILCPYRSRDSRFAIDAHNRFQGITDTTILYDKKQSEDLRYIAAILSSTLMLYRHKFLSKLCGGGTYEYFENTVSKLPIIRSAPGESAHDQIVCLHKKAEELSSVLETLLIPEEQTAYQEKIDEIDREIDNSVFDLYEVDEYSRIRIKDVAKSEGAVF